MHLRDRRCGDGGTEARERLRQRPFQRHRDHGRGRHWLDDLGSQDITCDVPADQLKPASLETQSAWLRRWGIDELAEEARRAWHQGASRGDLAAVQARSRVGEAAALTDDGGLGAFLVLSWPAGTTAG